MATKHPRVLAKSDQSQPAHTDEQWRLFLAIELPPAIQQLIAAFQAELTGLEQHLRLVDPSLAHVTLHFMGNVLPERAELLGYTLPDLARRQPQLKLEIDRVGVFPPKRAPRVLWLGIGGDSKALIHLHYSLALTLETQGFDVESKRYHPHVTVARVREGAPESIGLRLTEHSLTFPQSESFLTTERAFNATQIVLMRSHLTKQGPRYEKLRTVSLGTQS
ncbi:RNA 2',3'-cyclic phosphodiesterase [soil metagenome]